MSKMKKRFEDYMLYNNGEVVKQMKSFIERVDRNKLFINANLEPTIEKIEDVEIYEDSKVLEYCKENDIQFVCYQALRRNRTAMRNYEVLVELAKKYNKTQNQIIINWIVKEKNISPLIKCTDVNRINENLSAMDFTMEAEDYKKFTFSTTECNNKNDNLIKV